MKITKHTSLPWRAEGQVILNSFNQEVVDNEQLQNNWEANAAFIVKACNTHDKLVTMVCKLMAMHGVVGVDYDEGSHVDNRIKEAHNLLNEVREYDGK